LNTAQREELINLNTAQREELISLNTAQRGIAICRPSRAAQAW
jgi:hypothetical protein